MLPSIKNAPIIGAFHVVMSCEVVPISLKLMLAEGEDKPPWKSSSIENGIPTKKLEVS